MPSIVFRQELPSAEARELYCTVEGKKRDEDAFLSFSDFLEDLDSTCPLSTVAMSSLASKILTNIKTYKECTYFV